MFISEMITKEERQKWKKGNSVFINSPTGSGKSYFITEELSQDRQQILLVSNRDLLRQQNSIAVRFKDNVETVNYQGLSNIEDLTLYFRKFDILVFDEVHYVFADNFNRTTDQALEFLTKPSPNHINIYLTATPEVVITVRTKDNFSWVYENEVNYDYIEKIYTFEQNDSVDRIIHSIPDNEKCIFFCSSAERAYELSKKYMSSSFICSKNNDRFYKYSSKSERANILSKERFESKFLFTTQVLDNGVNLKDESIKHIIIEMIDPVTFIQCLGRKRVLGEGDKINLYMKNYNNKILNGHSTDLRTKLNLARERWDLGSYEFSQKYKKVRLPDIIDNDMDVNNAMFYAYKYYQNLYYTLCVDADKKGYVKYICNKLNKDWKTVLSVEVDIAKVELVDILESYVGKDLDKRQQKQFIESVFCNTTIRCVNNSRGSGLFTLNSLLGTLPLPYIIVSKRITVKGNKKTLWTVERLEE